MTNFNFLLNNLSYLSNEDLVVRPMDSTCFRSAPVPPSFRLRLHPLRMVATLLLLLCLGVGNVWGTGATVALTTSNTSLSSSGITVNSNIAITFAKGSYNGLPSVNSTYTKIYAGNTITFTPTNATITKVVMTASSNDYIKTWNSTVGSVSVNNKTATWTGSQTSAFTFTNSATAQARITQIAITYTVNDSYTVTWTINPAAGGTLSATSGTSTTVTPNSAYTYGDPAYTVTTGTATVSQSTNTFTATPSANCTIRINMVEKPKYTVTLKDDNSTYTQVSYGASVTLPIRTGCSGYTFAGWTKSWVAEQSSWTTTAPTIIPAGSYTPSANENLYPVYTKTEGGSGASVGTAMLTESFEDFTENDCPTAPGASSTTYSNSITYSCSPSSSNSGTRILTSNGPNSGSGAKNIIVQQNGSFAISNIPTGSATTLTFSCSVKGSKTLTITSTNANVTLGSNTGTSTARVHTLTVSNNATSFGLNFAATSGNMRLDDISIEVATTSAGSTTSYISVPNCCENLGSINGSINLIQRKQSEMDFHLVIISVFQRSHYLPFGHLPFGNYFFSVLAVTLFIIELNLCTQVISRN